MKWMEPYVAAVHEHPPRSPRPLRNIPDDDSHNIQHVAFGLDLLVCLCFSDDRGWGVSERGAFCLSRT